jgi:RNA-binding protein
MPSSLTSAARRDLKARAQRLDPVLRLGREGMSDAFLQSLEAALTAHGLVKIRFADFKEEKKTLAPQIAERSGSELIMRVGNVAVYYRPQPAAD